MTKNQKTIEERIGEVLDDCLEWYERPGQPGVGDTDFNFEKATGQLKSLISDLLREIVGEDEGVHSERIDVLDNRAWEEIEKMWRNKVRQEIRQRAKKLGIEI